MTGARREAACGALAAILDAVAAGRFPAADGRVTILPQPSARDAGVIAFTGHSVVFTDAEHGWVSARLPAGDLSAPLSPRFLHALAEHTGRVAHGTDLLTCTSPLPGPPPIDLADQTDPAHPRIARALRYRDGVRAWQADGGVVLIGRGPAGRLEVAVEVDPELRGRGLGRELALAARHLVAGGVPLWAQIAPGNAASVRAFLAAGYRPVGAEALLPLPGAGPERPAPGPSGAAAARDATMAAMTAPGQVIDNTAQSRFEFTADGALAELVYRRRADRLVLVHTEVPGELGGRGIGGLLVRAALARAAADGLTVVPLCPFARTWLERHPDAAAGIAVDWEGPASR